MLNMRKEDLIEIMHKYAHVMGKKLTETDYNVWYSLLSGYKIRDIDHAFEVFLKSNRNYPKPHGIISILTRFRDVIYITPSNRVSDVDRNALQSHFDELLRQAMENPAQRSSKYNELTIIRARLNNLEMQK